MLVRNVVGELQRKITLAASRGFLAAARLSCFDWWQNIYRERERSIKRGAWVEASRYFFPL